MNTIQKMNETPHERHIACIAKEFNISSPILKEPPPEKHTNNTDDDEDPQNFTIPVYRKFKIRIYKPLIFLKLALFMWYGGKGVGGLIGGLIMDAFGERIAFRVMALICLTAAIFHAIYFYIRKTCYTLNFNIDKGNGAKNQEQNEINTMQEERYNLKKSGL